MRKWCFFLWTARSCSEPPVRGLRHEDIACLRCLVIQKPSRNSLTVVHADFFDSLNFNIVGSKMIAKSTCKSHGMYHERILQTIETWNDVKSLISSPMVDFRCVFVDPTFQSMICSPFPVPTRLEWPEKKKTQTIYYPHLAMKASSTSWRAHSRRMQHSTESPRWQLTWPRCSWQASQQQTTWVFLGQKPWLFGALKENQLMCWCKKGSWISLSTSNMNSNFSFACRGDSDSSHQVDLYLSIRSSGGGPQSMIVIQGL